MLFSVLTINCDVFFVYILLQLFVLYILLLCNVVEYCCKLLCVCNVVNYVHISTVCNSVYVCRGARLQT